ncbi:MAG: alpha/beta hydrolase [Candidatus Omnitrophota bacterium]
MCVKSRIYLTALLVLVMGCATLPNAGQFAQSHGFEKKYLKTTHFSLASQYRFAKVGEPITIYIEGDGCAWVNRNQVSSDPTPKNQLVLALAAIDPASNVAYLARPGQYPESGKPDCALTYWTDKRFSEEVVSSMNEAIDQLAFRVQANKINLVGYSGGAAVAVLIASRRNDVISLRTIAGNLDPNALNRYHKVSELKNALNPMDVAEKVKNIPQRHFVGSQDKIVPVFIAESFVKRMGEKNILLVIVVDGATHATGWLKQWKKLLDYPLGEAW